MYPLEPELPTNEQSDDYKSLKYRFMIPYQAELAIDNFDIDRRYCDTPRVQYKNKPREDQTKWILS
jgi:hypothetical protein